MKGLRDLLPSIALSMVLASSATSLCQTTNLNVVGQQCDEPVLSGYGIPNYEPNQGWAAGSTVQVNIVQGDLTDDQVQAIRKTVENWSGVGGVTLNVTVDDPNFQAGTKNTLAISQADQSMGPDLNADTNGGPGPDGTEFTSSIVLNPDVQNLQGVANVISHEVGHTFGLDDNPDCPTCAMIQNCQGMRSGLCGSPFPTEDEISAADCEDNYSGNSCVTPGNTTNPNCGCGGGTSGDCSGGLVCGANGQTGICGCTDPCDDPYCTGWDSSCGTCRDDGDCDSDYLACVNGQCVSNGYCAFDTDCSLPEYCQNGQCVDGGGGGGGGGGGNCDGDPCNECDYNESECDGQNGECANECNAIPVREEIAIPDADPNFLPAAVQRSPDAAHPMSLPGPVKSSRTAAPVPSSLLKSSNTKSNFGSRP